MGRLYWPLLWSLGHQVTANFVSGYCRKFVPTSRVLRAGTSAITTWSSEPPQVTRALVALVASARRGNPEPSRNRISETRASNAETGAGYPS